MHDRSHPYYCENQARFLQTTRPLFDAMLQAAQDMGLGDQTQDLLHRGWERFETRIPALPYIGGDENFLTTNLVTGALKLSIYHALHNNGYANEQIGHLFYETVLAISPSAPVTPPGQDEVERILTMRREAAARSQVNPTEYDWQTTFIEGDDERFDWGVDYISCGICQLFREERAADFIPYLCFLDLPQYKARGIGLVRTQTLALGAEKCDFRFNLRGEYSLEWAPDFYQE